MDHGADLSSFVFPDSSYFSKRFGGKSQSRRVSIRIRAGHRRVSRKEKGIQADLRRRLVDEWWRYDDGGAFAADANKHSIGSGPTRLSELVCLLQPRQAEKLVICMQYYDCNRRRSSDEIMTRGFSRRWALEPFWELTGYRLPILCCEMIVKNLKNDDLGRVCLSAKY
uniref:Uncharacterized protein n=1 Tax=Trichogramma kaykai TaxID=54128 RepID=A0ABD2WSG6_9HYME